MQLKRSFCDDLHDMDPYFIVFSYNNLIPQDRNIPYEAKDLTSENIVCNINGELEEHELSGPRF